MGGGKEVLKGRESEQLNKCVRKLERRLLRVTVCKGHSRVGQKRGEKGQQRQIIFDNVMMVSNTLYAK